MRDSCQTWVNDANNCRRSVDLSRAFEVTGNRQFRLVERQISAPLPGQVRLRVQARGACYSDVLAVEGLRADPSIPIVPSHEIAGVIDAVGAGVPMWKVGDRVGVGYLNGHCGECEPCRRGDFANCANQQHTGTTVDGGYAEVAYARASGLVRLPEGADAVDIASLLCAGLTICSALARSGARPGPLVAIQGIGGLGHLGISTRQGSVTASRRSPEAAPRPTSPRDSVLTTSSTAKQRIRAPRYG